MNKYISEGTPKTPNITFDMADGSLSIKGPSTPENSIEFYKPLMDILDKYAVASKPVTNVNVQLEYFNTSSSKCILVIFKKFENIKKAGNAVVINWHYDEDDEDMLQAGQDFDAITNVHFNMIPVPQ